jgi:hypothetical protein
LTRARGESANAEGADWREVARIALHIDPDREPDRARQAFDNDLARVKRMARRDTALASTRLTSRN